MNIFKLLFLLSCCYAVTFGVVSAQASDYPEESDRKESPGQTVYYIDPVKGDNNAKGTKESPWKSFKPVNSLLLSPGDRLEVLAPGELRDSLYLQGKGTSDNPVVINFAPGRYDWFTDGLLKRKLQISNTNDAPEGDKAIAFDLAGAQHFRIEGNGAVIYARGKMMFVRLDSCRDIVFSGIGFDYQRPTVSEYTIENLEKEEAVIKVHQDSPYRIDNGKLIWIGEGWECGIGGYGQVYKKSPVTLKRCGSPLGKVDRVEEIAPGKIKAAFKKNPGFEKGATFQHREAFRDYSGVFCYLSEDVTWNHVKFYFIHGMGVVSQFSKNLTFKDLHMAPRPDSGRTCSAWADMLHFSGCAGKIVVNGAYFSGSNDDPINVHGTHLRVIETLVPNKVKVRFVHNQTFGFPAFVEGDEIAYIDRKTLCSYGNAIVKKAEMLNDREMLLTLDKSVENIKLEDVLENVTWTPSVEIRNCVIDADPTRGFLVSTRKPVIIENNVFNRTMMSAILVASDANFWFESGRVTDMTIRNNKFIDCGEPVIDLHPETIEASKDDTTHSNIKIIDNIFEMKGRNAVSIRSTGNVVISGNEFILKNGTGEEKVEDLIRYHSSPKADLKDNRIKSEKTGD